MIEGTLIAESLRVGTKLEELKLTVRKISRYRAQGTTPDQPDIWTTLDFEADEAEAEGLAQAFADALDQSGGQPLPGLGRQLSQRARPRARHRPR